MLTVTAMKMECSAHTTLARLIGHGYSVHLEYFHDKLAARAAYPMISFDVGDRVRDEGAVILAANPSIINDALTPRVKTSGAFSPELRHSTLVASSPLPLAGTAGGALHDITLPLASGLLASMLRASSHQDGGRL